MLPDARSRIVRLLLVALVSSSTLRCGDAPTQPATRPMMQSASSTAAAATEIRLGGRWHGTFTFVGCSEEIQVTLTHTGNGISGQFGSGCAGMGVPLTGTISGDALTVQLLIEGSRYILRGTATDTTIDVSFGGAMALHLVRSFTFSPRQ